MTTSTTINGDNLSPKEKKFLLASGIAERSKLFKLSSKINCSIKNLYTKLNLSQRVASKGQLSNLINHFLKLQQK